MVQNQADAPHTVLSNNKKIESLHIGRWHTLLIFKVLHQNKMTNLLGQQVFANYYHAHFVDTG